MLTFEQLLEGFRGLGVQEGDTLLVHSSYKSFGEVDGGPQTVIPCPGGGPRPGRDPDHADL